MFFGFKNVLFFPGFIDLRRSTLRDPKGDPGILVFRKDVISFNTALGSSSLPWEHTLELLRMQIGNLAGCQVEGWSLTPCRPCEIFHMSARVERRYIFFQSINFGKLYEILGVQFQRENMVWISFGLFCCLGAFLAVGSCLGTGRSFWIQYLRVRHASLKTSSPILSLEANRGKPVGSAWDFLLQCTYTNASTHLCIPTKHCILHTAYQRSHYQCRHVIGMSL